MSTPSRKVHVSRGLYGAEEYLKISNNLNQTIESGDLHIEVDTPKNIFVEIGQSTRVSEDSYKVQHSVAPQASIHLPIWIERAIGTELEEGTLHLRILYQGNPIGEGQITISE